MSDGVAPGRGTIRDPSQPVPAPSGRPDDLLAAAADAMRTGDHRRAAELLEHHLTLTHPTPDGHMRLAAARRALGDAVGALDAVAGALKLAPHHFMALLMGGSLLAAMGRREEAARTYAAAIQHLPSAASLPAVLAREIDRARQYVADEAAWRQALSERIIAELQGADPDERRRVELFRSAMIEQADVSRGLFFPELPEAGFLDPAAFDGISALEGAFDTILAEFHNVVRERAPDLVSMLDHAPGTAAASEGARKWSVINLIRNGEIVEENARFCPETIRHYQDLNPPSIPGRSPNLMFSLLDARTRIPAHRGVTNTRLVLHLGLVIPPDCAIRVGAETRGWCPGKAMIFDDTTEHEAWNDSDQLRVVLLGDLWRPEMTPRERGSVAALMARPAMG